MSKNNAPVGEENSSILKLCTQLVGGGLQRGNLPHAKSIMTSPSGASLYTLLSLYILYTLLILILPYTDHTPPVENPLYIHVFIYIYNYTRL